MYWSRDYYAFTFILFCRYADRVMPVSRCADIRCLCISGPMWFQNLRNTTKTMRFNVYCHFMHKPAHVKNLHYQMSYIFDKRDFKCKLYKCQGHIQCGLAMRLPSFIAVNCPQQINLSYEFGDFSFVLSWSWDSMTSSIPLLKYLKLVLLKPLRMSFSSHHVTTWGISCQIIRSVTAYILSW